MAQAVRDTRPLRSFFVVVLKLMCNNHPTLHPVSSSAYTNWINFYQSIPKIWNRNKILIKGHNSVKNKKNKMCNGFYQYVINIDTCTKFDNNPSINSQDIEHKQN